MGLGFKVLGIYCGDMGIMEEKTETTTMGYIFAEIKPLAVRSWRSLAPDSPWPRYHPAAFQEIARYARRDVPGGLENHVACLA